MSGSIQPLPVTSDLATLAAVMNANGLASGEWQGRTITLDPGDVTPGSGGSVTDAEGNVYTLPLMTSTNNEFGLAWPAGVIQVNGVSFPGAAFTDAIRVVDGVLYAEDAKGFGWLSYQGTNIEGVAPGDPGPGDGTTGGTPSSPPVPPVSSAPPASPAGDAGGGTPTPSNPSENIITAGDGSTLTDSAGNVFSVDANGNAIENGSRIVGGSGTSALASVNGQIEGQDAHSQQWFTWNGSVWIPGAAGPDPTIVVGLGVNKALTGGGGNISFLLDGGGHTDTITDWQPSDHIEFQNTTKSAVLTANDVGGSAVVTFGNDTVTLNGVAASSLSASNFVFPSGDNVQVIINGHS
ncbi:MAG TPA: hypothetical protein VL614_01300 [Acetobacteraceae bacterium]|jgi:hypothetical protein|nr:hypothetical protein [Acetobacteraceae bacterium]